MIEEIHYQLRKMGIKHVCHYSLLGGFDLVREAVICTECRIANKEISLADVVMKRVDPLNEDYAWDEYRRKYEEERNLRVTGLLPKHALYMVGGDKGRYQRVECFLERGSASVSDDRICLICKQSVDD